jgi:hypothetical protein
MEMSVAPPVKQLVMALTHSFQIAAKSDKSFVDCECFYEILFGKWRCKRESYRLPMTLLLWEEHIVQTINNQLAFRVCT